MVDVGVQRRLVARDLETDKLVAWAVLRVLQQGPAAVEVALVEVDQAAGAQPEGRAAAGRHNGGLRRLEIGAADVEAGLDARKVERGIDDRPDAIVRIGKAWCRRRVCQCVQIAVIYVFKKTQNKNMSITINN